MEWNSRKAELQQINSDSGSWATTFTNEGEMRSLLALGHSYPALTKSEYIRKLQGPHQCIAWKLKSLYLYIKGRMTCDNDWGLRGESHWPILNPFPLPSYLSPVPHFLLFLSNTVLLISQKWTHCLSKAVRYPVINRRLSSLWLACALLPISQVSGHLCYISAREKASETILF